MRPEGRGRGRGRHEEAATWGGRRRLRHGDVRAALLGALLDGPAHGYELGSRLERRSLGAWRPSPGSIYPTLQVLADEGLVTVEECDGKRIYQLTRGGKAEALQRTKLGEGAPWKGAEADEAPDLREAVHQVLHAAKQVSAVGTIAQRTHARAILLETRQKLYELLAKG